MEEICYRHEHQNSLEILYLILMKRRLNFFLLAEKTEKNRDHFARHRWGIQENPL